MVAMMVSIISREIGNVESVRRITYMQLYIRWTCCCFEVFFSLEEIY
jgi:hypothetical protein